MCQGEKAAIAVDINQYLVTQNQAPLGHVNATLYTLASATQPFVAFHDVTSGTNLYYPAHVGYDLATGLGTPDAWNLTRDAVVLFGGVTHALPSPSPTLFPTLSPTPNLPSHLAGKMRVSSVRCCDLS